METHAPQHENHTMTNFISALCFIFSGFIEWIRHITPSDAYDFVWRSLSLASLSMIIVINYPKFKDAIKQIREKKDESKRK